MSSSTDFSGSTSSTVAVTGAAGYVGLNLVAALTERGHQVVAIDRRDHPLLRRPGVRFEAGDVLDAARMRECLAGADVVYHLVAMITLKQRDEQAWRVNTEGVRVVARAAHEVGVRRLVHCSSLHAFDQYHPVGPLDETVPRSTDPALPVYDRSKWAGEQALHEVIADGLHAVIANPTGIYGPIDPDLSRMNRQLLLAARGRVPVSVRGGFDFVDVRDVAQGLIAAAERGRRGENYILGGGFSHFVDLHRMVATEAGRRPPRAAVPTSVLRRLLPVADLLGRIGRSDALSRAAFEMVITAPVVDSGKARRELDWTPRPSAETVRDLVAHYAESGVPGVRAAAGAGDLVSRS